MVSIKIRPGKTRRTAPEKRPREMPDFSKPWAIWLDDERPVPERSGLQYVAAANPREFISLIEEHGVPSFISFDWYLGPDWDNGEAVVKWLIESDRLGEHVIPEDFMFDVHSSDNSKNRAMHALLSDYLISRGDMEFFRPRDVKQVNPPPNGI